MLRVFTVGTIVLFSLNIWAADIPKVRKQRFKKLFTKEKAKCSKVTAATFDITLGLFGVHRLYLGTRPIVPMVYAITLGGGGFLVLADLGVILFSKDLEKYADNDHIFMWNINERPLIE